jgi:hypothetical protein
MCGELERRPGTMRSCGRGDSRFRAQPLAGRKRGDQINRVGHHRLTRERLRARVAANVQLAAAVVVDPERARSGLDERCVEIAQPHPRARRISFVLVGGISAPVFAVLRRRGQYTHLAPEASARDSADDSLGYGAGRGTCLARRHEHAFRVGFLIGVRAGHKVSSNATTVASLDSPANG